MDSEIVIVGGVCSVLICLIISSCLIWLTRTKRQISRRNTRQRQIARRLTITQPQDQNVFNISSRVQGQEQRHPDAFVSLEHITIMNELNKPPKYDDAPPSYEEAIKIAMAQDNSLKTFQTEVAASQGTSSSSSAAATSSAATPQIQPAIPNRTE
ncbi:uncharacterized protein LOC143201430 isoform X4 [Rhynchophorus ferrugineus]|uniref:uncharacterized protein LOC143201430 isoform X4 n=1 Tax=Rhynchophorus ferrugineus TaxID=354439 RepID=UPI003FCD1F08